MLGNTLRPKALSEFIGQKEIIYRLKVMIESAKIRSEPVDHILFSGPPGLGKTTLGSLIAKEIGSNFYPLSAPTITKTGDLAKILTLLKKTDVLFIDEIHRLNRSCEEILYSAMEDHYIDILLGEGVTAKSIRIPLEPFTLIGATTRSGYLSPPLKSRFGVELKLSFYSIEDLSMIIKKNAKLLELDLEEGVETLIAENSRMTPREAIRLLKRIQEFAIIKRIQKIDIQFIKTCFRSLGIFRYGINEIDKKILSLLYERYNGNPVGIKTLSSLLDEEERTLLEVHEPFLLKMGLIEKTSKGRQITAKGIEFLKEYEVYSL
ncbi:MAG: Holliday junction branch migration DNA helicase RuvB [Leptonema sp. (in: bacteria)]